MTFEEAIAQVAPGETKEFEPTKVDRGYVAPYGKLFYNRDWGDPGLRLDAEPEEMPQPCAYLRKEFVPPSRSFSAVFERDRDNLDLYVASGAYIVVSERFKELLLEEPGLSLNVWPVEAIKDGKPRRFFLLAPKTSTQSLDVSRTPFMVKKVDVGVSDRVVSHIIFQRDFVFTKSMLPALFFDTYAHTLFIGRQLAERLRNQGVRGFCVLFSSNEIMRA